MVATSNAPEERQTLLDPDPAPTRSSGCGSFARYATAGTFLAGLAVAAVTTSGTADASAIARVKLGDASADLPGHPQHAEAVGHRLTPEAVRWWHEHHPKQPVLGDFDEMGKRASVNTDEKSGAHDEDVASTGKRGDGCPLLVVLLLQEVHCLCGRFHRGHFHRGSGCG